MTRARAWVVEFAGCGEAVIRTGASIEEVNQPDDLGCPVLRIRPLLQVELRGGVWEKDGELRCEIL
jgi:hypothetical protein